MDPRLMVASQRGDVDSLYSLINEDEYILEHLDKVPFINTPLHIAAAAGHPHFCMEIMRLKPSYAKKLNKNGYCPIHLALQNQQTQLVLRLLDVDRELVRVQGREGKTVLHFAAEFGMVDLLAEFLSICPSSIQDLTIRKETALHVAVKNSQLEVVKVIMGWLELVGKDAVLKWTDDEGNTILHAAALTNQTEMLSLLINKSVDINAKNLAGLTALDIIQNQSNQSDSRKHLRRMLFRGGALKTESLPNVPPLSESLKTKMSWREKWILSDYRRKLYLSNEDRNIVLLVAVLFATANYQAALDSDNSIKDNPPEAIAPTVNRYDVGDIFFYIFSYVNNIAFFASMVEICSHLPSNSGILRVLLLSVICNYALIKFEPGLILAITISMLLFYHSKMARILQKFVPISVFNKSVKIKCSILGRFSSFHGELEA